MASVIHQFIEGLQATTMPEFIAVITGIIGVLFSRSANIWLYPFGIVSTIIYVYISFVGGLYAEAGLNIYYTLMNIAGWYMWSRRAATGESILHITLSDRKDWLFAILFFSVMWLLLFLILFRFTNSTVPHEDAFASAAAYTGMLLMNKKKVENWFWWILTNIVSIPLYFVKGYVFTSVQFMVLLIIAISGWFSWYKKWQQQQLSTVK